MWRSDWLKLLGWLAARNPAQLMDEHGSWTSVQFSSVPWPTWSSGGHEGRLSKDPIPVSSAGSHCEQFWREQGCALFGWRGVWHTWTIQVSVSKQLPEEVPLDPQGSWSCSAPNRWSFAPSRRCGEVSSGTGFRKPGPFFFFSQQAGWPRGLGDGHWPQVWDLPKIPPRARRGIKSRTHRNVHRLPYGKKCRVARWPRGLGDWHWPQVWDLPERAKGKEKWPLLNNHISLGWRPV